MAPGTGPHGRGRNERRRSEGLAGVCHILPCHYSRHLKCCGREVGLFLPVGLKLVLWLFPGGTVPGGSRGCGCGGFSDLVLPVEILRAQLQNVIVGHHLYVLAHVAEGRLDVPAFVFEESQVVGDQVPVLASRALDDDDALRVGVFRELLDGPGVADRAREDDGQLSAPLLGSRNFRGVAGTGGLRDRKGATTGLVAALRNERRRRRRRRGGTEHIRRSAAAVGCWKPMPTDPWCRRRVRGVVTAIDTMCYTRGGCRGSKVPFRYVTIRAVMSPFGIKGSGNHSDEAGS